MIISPGYCRPLNGLLAVTGMDFYRTKTAILEVRNGTLDLVRGISCKYDAPVGIDDLGLSQSQTLYFTANFGVSFRASSNFTATTSERMGRCRQIIYMTR